VYYVNGGLNGEPVLRRVDAASSTIDDVVTFPGFPFRSIHAFRDGHVLLVSLRHDESTLLWNGANLTAVSSVGGETLPFAHVPTLISGGNIAWVSSSNIPEPCSL
jgi:hypothetical protein